MKTVQMSNANDQLVLSSEIVICKSCRGEGTATIHVFDPSSKDADHFPAKPAACLRCNGHGRVKQLIVETKL